MKQPKKLTRTMKEFLSKKGYDAEKYFLVSETKEKYEFVERGTKNIISFEK